MTTPQLEITRLSQPLRLWERIELVVGPQESCGRYWTRVEDFLNDGIVISEPQFVLGRSLLREGCEVMVVITRKDAAYRFYSRIQTFGTRGQRTFLLRPPRRVQRLQRRRTARIDFSTAVTYARITGIMEWEDVEDRLRWNISNSINISAGGLLMKCRPTLEVGDVVLLQIALLEQLQLPQTLAGAVRRLTRSEEDHWAGVEFITDTMLPGFLGSTQIKRLPTCVQQFGSREQNHLANYIFRRQVELRQKGLL
ncbi:MAG: flagellar brake protein [bacterium]